MFYNVKFPGTHINVRRLKGTGEINLITFYLNQYIHTNFKGHNGPVRPY